MSGTSDDHAAGSCIKGIAAAHSFFSNEGYTESGAVATLTARAAMIGRRPIQSGRASGWIMRPVQRAIRRPMRRANRSYA